jgi:chromosome segregation protein
LTQLRFDFRQRESQHSAAIHQVSRLNDDIQQYENKVAVLNGTLQNLQERLNAAGSEVERSAKIVEEIKIQVKETENRLTASRIRTVELDGLAARIDSEIEHAKEMIVEAEKLINSNDAGIAAAEGQIERSAKKIDELKNELEIYFTERSKAKDQLLEIEGVISEKIENIGGLEKALVEKRKSKDKNLSALHNLDMELMELDSRRNSIVEKIKFEFNVTSIEPAELPGDQTIESLKEQGERIRQELQRMEPVNLMAAEDYERENDRFNFLIRQRDDLLEAKASLKEAISRINTTAEERFNKTFSQIESNYQQVFSTLFENGEAHIALEDPSLPLESPIKIMARPGGKKLLSVAQLSGGERALTAISLLFAIYLVKPSPFCILDEVDAPLDDINLMRFLKLIKEFSKDTQFIIITHNKLTMEASDILYGVTMENPGVSKVVSVKFGGGNGDGN